MPVMDGLTATRKIRQMGLNIPIIGVSASFSAGDIIEMKKSGMTTSIGKPLRKEKLLSFLADVLS
jgi:CheY-like chemotaxis protein